MKKGTGLYKRAKEAMEHKMTVIPVVMGALGTISKGLVKGLEDLEIRGQVANIQTIALLRSVRILRRVLGNEEACCHQ